MAPACPLVSLGLTVCVQGGFAIEQAEGASVSDIVLSSGVLQSCSSDGSFSCVIRADVVRGEVTTPYAVQPLSSGFNRSGDPEASRWITTHLVGNSEYGRGLADNFTSFVRQRFELDDKTRRAWYINAGHKWVAQDGAKAQSILELSDSVILIAVLALHERPLDPGSRRLLRSFHLSVRPPAAPSRRLLDVPTIGRQEKEDMAMQALLRSPRAGNIPPIKNVVYLEEALQRLYNVGNSTPHRLFELQSIGRFSAGYTTGLFCAEVTRRLTQNLQRFSPNSFLAHIPSCTARVLDAPATPAGRTLLQEQDGTILLQANSSILFLLDTPAAIIYYPELFSSLLNSVYHPSATTPGPAQGNLSHTIDPKDLLLHQIVPFRVTPTQLSRSSVPAEVSLASVNTTSTPNPLSGHSVRLRRGMGIWTMILAFIILFTPL